MDEWKKRVVDVFSFLIKKKRMSVPTGHEHLANDF